MSRFKVMDSNKGNQQQQQQHHRLLNSNFYLCQCRVAITITTITT